LFFGKQKIKIKRLSYLRRGADKGGGEVVVSGIKPDDRRAD